MTDKLEIDFSHKSLVAGWFGTKCEDDKPNQGKVDHEENRLDTHYPAHTEKKESAAAPVDLTTYVEGKLKKKLHKNKRKHNELSKEEAQDVSSAAMPEDEDSEEDSRTTALSKKKIRKVDVQRPELLTTEGRRKHIEERLADPSLTKNVRKRLRKRLTDLNNTVSTPSSVEENNQSGSPQHEKNSNKQSDDNKETKGSTDDIADDTVATSPSSEITPSDDHNDQDEIKSNNEEPTKTHRRRKRKKTRSKQKNIRKDNRPDHLKPGYVPPDQKS